MLLFARAVYHVTKLTNCYGLLRSPITFPYHTESQTLKAITGSRIPSLERLASL